jgi:hypothetical protein
LKEELVDSQTAKTELHMCSSATVVDTNVITVGYALSKDPTSVVLSHGGLSDKSLPFLTKPSNVFAKEGSVVGLKEFTLEDHFHTSNNMQRTKKPVLTQSQLNNGETDTKDCLNWSKTLKLSPKLLGKSDLNPGGESAKPGVIDQISNGGVQCMSQSFSTMNGDDAMLHGDTKLSVSGSNGMEYTDAIIDSQGLSPRGSHNIGLPARTTSNVLPTLETGLAVVPLHQMANEVGDDSMQDIESKSGKN